MMITKQDAVELAKYLMSKREIKQLTESQIENAFNEAKIKIESKDYMGTEDSQYDFELDTIENKLRNI